MTKLTSNCLFEYSTVYIQESETAEHLQPYDTGAGAGVGAGEEANAITNNPAWVQEDDSEEFARKQMLEWGFEI